MRLIQQRRRPHYAWLILVSVMVLLAISSALRYSFGVLIDPLVEEYGWSRGAVSSAYSLQFLVSIPAVLITGWLAEKIGSRRIAIGGTLVFTVGMLLTATVTQPWQFQLYFGVLVGGLGASVFMALLPVLLTHWFHKKLGLALGLMWVSTGLGAAVLSPLMRWALETMGWTEAFVVLGFTGGTLMLISSFFLRNHPREKNLAPYGGSLEETRVTDTDFSAETFGLRQVVVMTSFWALIAVHTLGCIGHSIPVAHMVSMATFAGLPGVAAAGVLSISLAASLISRFGMSLLAEAKGGRFTLALAVLLQTLPMLLLLSTGELRLFYSFAFLFGIGYGGEMVGFPIFNRQYYGADAPLNTIYAYQMAGAMVGMAVGGWVGGALFDLTGSYTWSILASVGAGFIGLMAALVLPSHHR